MTSCSVTSWSERRAAPSAHWLASLRLELARRGARTVISSRRHEGPLLVQRAFHEPDGSCQVYLIHPPAGVVGGDVLQLEVRAQRGARALITTPAATKLYRCPERRSRQTFDFKVASAGTLEWLPQETIAYQGSHSVTRTQIRLEGSAQFCGWEITCLGEDNRGLESGRLVQSFQLARDERLLWSERADYQADSSALRAPWGLAGRTVVGTFVSTGAEARHVEALRKLGAVNGTDREQDWLSATLLGEVLVCRYLGYRSDSAKKLFTEAWKIIRPDVAGRAVSPPRVWST